MDAQIIAFDKFHARPPASVVAVRAVAPLVPDDDADPLMAASRALRASCQQLRAEAARLAQRMGAWDQECQGVKRSIAAVAVSTSEQVCALKGLDFHALAQCR